MAKNTNTDAPQTGFGLGWWVAGGLLVVLIVGIIVGVVIWPRDTTAAPQNTTSPTATATGQAPTSAPAQAGTACTTGNASQTLPTEAPDTVWKTHPDQMLVPTSEKYGPSNQDGNLWSCFERSPTGAVFAGPNLLAAMSQGEANAAVPGPGRNEVMEQVESASSDYERPVVEGFRILAADKDRATINYWMTGEGTTAAYGLDLVWDETAGDWKLDFETPGDHPRVSVLEDTSPYVRWR